MTDHHIEISFSDEDGGYVADIPDLEACSAFGATVEEALSQVKLAEAAWREAAEKLGKPIPSPHCRTAATECHAGRNAKRTPNAD